MSAESASEYIGGEEGIMQVSCPEPEVTEVTAGLCRCPTQNDLGQADRLNFPGQTQGRSYRARNRLREQVIYSAACSEA